MNCYQDMKFLNEFPNLKRRLEMGRNHQQWGEGEEGLATKFHDSLASSLIYFLEVFLQVM